MSKAKTYTPNKIFSLLCRSRDEYYSGKGIAVEEYHAKQKEIWALAESLGITDKVKTLCRVNNY